MHIFGKITNFKLSRVVAWASSCLCRGMDWEKYSVKIS